jgi:hypothetical protein
MAVEWLALMLRVCEDPGSNTRRKRGTLTEAFRDFHQAVQAKAMLH